ncbi:hypothetical protein PLESTB_001577300 [Pleodorina starrii]|uniref:Uncharacterized protein n=2 Tax=Pleodorina starrii TaxID=330485 RepID=A0A9W6F895_9CHLO|nr:hypothetical protein PLESTB_001577300 [Pleodorina starrii]
MDGAHPDGDLLSPAFIDCCTGGLLLTNLPELVSTDYMDEMGAILKQKAAVLNNFAPLLQSSKDGAQKEVGDCLADKTCAPPLPATVDIRGQPLSLAQGDKADIGHSLVIVNTDGAYSSQRDACLTLGPDGTVGYRLPTRTLCLPLLGRPSLALMLLAANDGKLSNSTNCYAVLQGTRVHLGLPPNSPLGATARIELTPLAGSCPYRQPTSSLGLALAASLGRPALEVLASGYLKGTGKTDQLQLREKIRQALTTAYLSPSPRPLRDLSPLVAPQRDGGAVSLDDLMALGDEDPDPRVLNMDVDGENGA